MGSKLFPEGLDERQHDRDGRIRRKRSDTIVGPRGGKGPERTVVRCEPLPPTPSRNSTYTLVDPTKINK